MLIVGEKEMNEKKVAVRRHGEGDKGAVETVEFIREIKSIIKEQTNGRKATATI